MMTSYYPGLIVRINLENFMSYDSIEIHPGKNLNLIIGPNGTGKSSIVCAVLLGLGGKLKTLGRADQLGSYVKSGCDQCIIEIELYNPEGENIVIKKKILSNNKSEFIVNGSIVKDSKINEIRKAFNIEIDNLCTFLPQEKVQDFARLNPQQLLEQTQKTIGHGHLVELHEDLKKLQYKVIEEEKNKYLLQEELENEKQKNERIKDKIKSFKEKQSLCDKMIVLNQKKAWVCYEDEVKNKKDIDKDYLLAEKVYNSKKKEVQEIKKSLEELDQSLSSDLKKLSDAKKDEAGKKEVLQDWIKRGERRIDKLQDLKSIVQMKLNDEEEKKKELLKYNGNIEKLSNDLQTLNANIGSETQFRSEKEKVDLKLKNIHIQETCLNQLKVELEDEEETLSHEMRQTVRRLESLKNCSNNRLEYLKRNEPDVYKSIEWIERNKHLFHSQIYNPMLLELDVPDSKMAKYVETVVKYRDLISFTCTNPDDLNLLIKNLRTERKLKVNAICSDDYDNSQYFPDIPINDIKPLGFHSYLKDLIKGPEDILRYLCKTYRIHRVPVGDENVKANYERVPKSITVFYSENDVFNVKYSVYSKEKSVIVKKLNEPKFFTQSSDESLIKTLSEGKKDLENKIKSKKAKIKDVDDKINDLKKELDEVRNTKRELSTKEEERQQIKRNLDRAVSSYNSKKEKLRDPNEIKTEAEEERETLKREICKNIEEIKTASENVKKSRLARQTYELQYNINTFERNQILENEAQILEELSEKEVFLHQMKERQRTAELKCLQLKEIAQKLTDNISIDDHRKFQKFQAKFAHLPNSAEEIESEIVETQTKADFLQGGNYQILQDYEQREATIAQLSENLEKCKKNVEEKMAELNSKQNRWLIPVKELVSKINVKFGKFFEAMGCAGEISLISGEKENEFDKYGIRIAVKFREETAMQELGPHFQSGGERAVATAIFMLSLLELTSVPFRFVDEINQGMDPENERRILQLIIRVTESEKSTQYFFITPKLLANLKCSETMTVLCIYNGPFAIPATEWNLKKFLNQNSEVEMDED